MPLLSAEDLHFAEALSKLTYCNHFLPERIDHERDALGEHFVPTDFVWSRHGPNDQMRQNLVLLRERNESITDRLRVRLAAGDRASGEELRLYEDLSLYLLYTRCWPELQNVIEASEAGSPKAKVPFYEAYLRDYRHYLNVPGVRLPNPREPELVFAGFFQIRRAFHLVFNSIAGASLPAAKLRACVWQSIFTHDLRRYLRTFYDRMGDMTTLVTGPSGTGKELVARAIAMARFIPFDPKTRTFASDFKTLFFPLNLSALSPTLIESELFGHRRGAFTGALEDRAGWLQTCPMLGTVFLDEIGDLDPMIQVKLLRVLQSRMFQRLGDTKDLHFQGKIIAATNRTLAEQMQRGKFREDFYYRLCSDIIVTPSLREQLESAPHVLREMIHFITQRIAADEADELTDEVEKWIRIHLGDDYPWSGNFRELEQCVKNIVIRRDYQPARLAARSYADALVGQMQSGQISADDLIRKYCRLIYDQTGSYEETARRLGLDRRTVKAKVS